MRWRGACAWLRGRRAPSRECEEARRASLLSQAKAELDWQEAVDLRPEAEEVTQLLRAHNVANSYDDWVRECVQW